MSNTKVRRKYNSYSEKHNKMQQCIKIYCSLFEMKLNMFRATHRQSSGA